MRHRSGEPHLDPTREADVHYVYVLRNPDGRLYIGSTSDLERRVRRHQQGRGGWTRDGGPWEPVYHEQFPTRAEAVRRERYLKSGKPNQEFRARFATDSR